MTNEEFLIKSLVLSDITLLFLNKLDLSLIFVFGCGATTIFSFNFFSHD